MARLLAHRSLLILKGEQSLPLLQGIITKDVRALDEIPSASSFILDTNGRIVDEILLRRRNEEILIECSTQRRPQLKTILEKYRLRKKVGIELSDESVLWSREEINGENGEKDPRLNSIGWRIYRNANGEMNTDDEYREMRYELGVGEGEELCGLLPWNCNGDLLHHISINKGCYIGQELTARTATQGMLRRRIVPFTTNTTVSGDVKSADGKKAGKIICSSSKRGLALIPLSSIDKELSVNGESIVPYLPSWMKNMNDLTKVYI